MRARPKSYIDDDEFDAAVEAASKGGRFDGREPKFVGGGSGEFGCWLECYITDPPSMVDRNIDLYIPPQMIEAMLKEFRRLAADKRKKTITESGASR